MTDYPGAVLDENGDQSAGNIISFTDPDNQPAAGLPFAAQPAPATTNFFVDSPDGDLILGFDADAGGTILSAYNWDFASKDLDSVGTLNASQLGSTIAFVAVQAGPPDPLGTYDNSPLVFDTTALTGGLYAWDGSAYVQVGGPLA